MSAAEYATVTLVLVVMALSLFAGHAFGYARATAARRRRVGSPE